MTIKKIKVPDIGADEVEIIEIMVNIGDKIEIDQPIIVVEGEKASMEIPSSSEGIIKKIIVKIGDKISTGSTIVIIEENSLNKSSNTHINSSKKLDKISVKNNIIVEKIDNFTEVHASPLIRRLSRKFGIDLIKIEGTGIKGRILKEDIYLYIRNSLLSVKENNNITFFKEIDFNKFGQTEIIKLGKIQKIASNNLSRNWINIPHVTLYDQVDITSLERFRKEQNNEFETKKIDKKITLLIFIIKIIAKALEMFPKFNSSISQDGTQLILKKYVNISIAIDTVYGLLVPVIFDANKKNITDLLEDLLQIFNKAHLNKLSVKDIQGGCFTISSLGGIGSALFNPIINAPEVAILGISKARIKPVWNRKKFVARLILPLSLSFDHRVINGAEGMHFINYIIMTMHDIRKLLI